LQRAAQNTRMMFFVFILLIYGMGLFHRFEHRAMIADLRALLPLVPMAGEPPAPHDWRRCGGTDAKPLLKRAFNPRGAAAALRYAMPVLFAAVMLIVLQAYVFAACYIALCAVKWFAVSAELAPRDDNTKDSRKGRYTLRLGTWTLLGEDI